MPMTFAGCDDNGITSFQILSGAAVRLDAHAALDNEKPLRTRVLVPVRSRTIRKRHAVHAHRNAGVVMSQPLHRRAAEEGGRIDRADRRVT